jgi:hypothetical protein
MVTPREPEPARVAPGLAAAPPNGAEPPPAEAPAPAAAGTAPPRPGAEAEAEAEASLPIGRIAASVVSGRLQDPRALAVATGLLAAVFLRIGIAIGRRR